ncbi:MAG: toll/interleukin-1 receptor domain-containing protein, partial [Thermoanaerobaculia bacterium]
IQEVEAAPAKPEKEAEAEVEADAEAEKEPAPVRDRVFISYAGEDEKKHKWLTRLQDHIDPLQDAFIEKRPELADEELIFDATKIKPGEQWRERIDEALARAKVGVLLVSKAFLVSPFIKTEEALPILLAAKEEGLTILWVLLDVCNWEQTEIAKFQAMNETKPLAVMKKTQAEKVLKKLSKLIFEELEK